MKPDNLSLPADVARCNGRVAIGNQLIPCEKRDKCKRWLATPVNHPRFVHILVAGKANLIDCEYFVPQGGDSDDKQGIAETA